MWRDRRLLVEQLTGIQASKRNHYADLKDRIAEVERLNVQLEVLNRISQSIRVDMSLTDVLAGVRNSLGRLLPSPQLWLHTVGADGAICLAADGQDGPAGLDGDLAWVLTHRRTLLLLPRGVAPADLPCATREGLDSGAVALIPLLARGRVVGVLQIGCHNTIALLAVGAHFLEQLGDQLAAAIVNNQLYAEVLQRQREWFETFNAIRNPILVLDRHGRIRQCNQAAVRFPDSAGGSCVGKPWWSVLLGTVPADHHGPVGEAIRNGTPISRRLQDEQGRLLEVSVHPLEGPPGWGEGAIVHARDVTDEIRYQVQVVQSARLAAIGQIAAGVAHELNSPLTAVLGNAQILMRSLPPDEASHALAAEIHACGVRCRRIVQDLLSFARRDEHRFALTDVNAVIQRVLLLLRHQLEQEGIRVEQSLAPDLPAVLANEYQIEQVLINLILNARDAVQGCARARVVRVSSGVRDLPSGRMVWVSVRDWGSGIAPKHLREIFNPFFTTKERGKGTGLGLSISLEIARRHGGTIEVESAPGEGSTFTLLLPLRSEEAVCGAGGESSVSDPGGR